MESFPDTPRRRRERMVAAQLCSRDILDFARDDALVRLLSTPRQQRFIGVIYRPQTEFYSHCAEVALSRQFDGWVRFDETSAVTPLGAGVPSHDEPPETWPFGF